MLINLYKLIAIIAPSEVNVPKADPSTALPKILTIVFATAGAVSLLIITIAGFRLVMSQGNPEGLSKARTAIIYALLGLLICISGTIIVRFVMVRV